MQGDNGKTAAIPPLDRLTYFYGQLLGANDFQKEQAYFRERMRLQNRCLHGYGVVCGLELHPLEQSHDCGAGEPPKPLLVLEPGLALDCRGNELIVREEICLDVVEQLSCADRKRVEEGKTDLYVTLSFHEQPIDPTRPALTDTCGAVAACTFGKVRETVCVGVAVDPPPPDERCETCCGACTGCALLLARIECFELDRPIEPAAVDTGVRRELATHVPARVSGISWSHGAVYSPEMARRILGTNHKQGGLEIRFTRPVHAADVRDPVLQILVAERGRGRSANVYELAGEFVGVPDDGLVEAIRYRQTSGETLQDGDLVMIVLRAPLLLDACCRPAEGLHAGGRVPLLCEYEDHRAGDAPTTCVRPPFRAGPWTSYGAGNFESWFFISSPEESE